MKFRIGTEMCNLMLCVHRMHGKLVLFSILHFGDVLGAICHQWLWKQRIARDIQKKDPRIAAGLSINVIAKLGKNQNVAAVVPGKTCIVMNCEITDINSKQREIGEVLK